MNRLMGAAERIWITFEGDVVRKKNRLRLKVINLESGENPKPEKEF